MMNRQSEEASNTDIKRAKAAIVILQATVLTMAVTPAMGFLTR